MTKKISIFGMMMAVILLLALILLQTLSKSIVSLTAYFGASWPKVGASATQLVQSLISLAAMVQGWLGLGLPDRVGGLQLDAMSIVDEPVEDGVGHDAGIEVGTSSLQLRGDDGRAHAVAVLDDLKQVFALLVVQD